MVNSCRFYSAKRGGSVYRDFTTCHGATVDYGFRNLSQDATRWRHSRLQLSQVAARWRHSRLELLLLAAKWRHSRLQLFGIGIIWDFCTGQNTLLIRV